jgi:hypothetical protein
MTDTDSLIPHEAEFLLYRTEDGRARVEVRFDGETAWLTQAAMAALFRTTPQTITRHVAAIYAEGELEEGATCTSYVQVQTEGARRVRRHLKHCSTPAETDRKVIAHVREYGKVTNRTVQNLFDLTVHPANNLLDDLIRRGILVKTSPQQRGPAVEYGPGPRFPKPPEAHGVGASPRIL